MNHIERPQVREAQWEKDLDAVDSDLMARLHRRLGTEAESAGLVDVAYRTVDSPVGSLLLAATEQGLVRIAYAVQDHDQVLETLATEISPRVLEAPGRLDPVAVELDEYFTGQRTTFDLPLDFRLSRGFRREVLSHLREIAYGHTASYGDVARLVGNPRAVRAVGTACALNPLPLVVPCHRVVRAGGAMGRYAGGEEAKRILLDLEAA